jgi:hypothetical protein
MADTEQPHIYPERDERPHPIGAPPFWQESVVITWADRATGWYGFHRLGHEPHANNGQGISTNWVGIVHRDGLRYHRHLNSPLRAADRTEDSFLGTDAFSARFSNNRARWIIDDPECRMDLVAEDFTPRFDLFRQGGTVVDDFAPGHIEAGSRVTGTLSLGGQQVAIDGLAYRDHSWGKRDWGTLLSHRWIAGTVGPALTFNAASWHGVDGSLRSFGIVVRDGKIDYATEVDIVVFMEIDAQTHRGGILSLTLDSGETITLHPKVVDGFLTHHNGIGCVDELCDVEWNGLAGFCDFEISTNPRRGAGPITGLIRATMEQGISRRTQAAAIVPSTGH